MASIAGSARSAKLAFDIATDAMSDAQYNQSFNGVADGSNWYVGCGVLQWLGELGE